MSNRKVKYAEPKKIQLSREYNFSGTWKDTLVMREPTIKDEKMARESVTDESQLQERLFCNLCDIEIEEIDQLALKDAYQITQAYNDFL
jgi:hypothetical protein